MKIFFFLVLLINIVFFLWEFKTGEEKVLTSNKDNTTEKISLLSELSKKELNKRRAIAVAKEQENVRQAEILKSQSVIEEQSNIDLESKVDLDSEIDLDSKPFCYQVGPFLNEVLLDVWIANNEIDVNSLTKVNEMKKKITGFLVYYPQADTYEQSKKNTRMLENKGFTDFWMFRKGELKGNISLGLFVEERRATALRNKLLTAGVNVKIMPRYRMESMWYVNILSNNKILMDGIMLSEQQSFLSCDHI